MDRLEAFGSVLRDDFDAERSAIDLLVEFKLEVAADFGNLLDLEQALESLFQRPVDLLEPHTIRNRRLAITSTTARHPSMTLRDPGVHLEDIERATASRMATPDSITPRTSPLLLRMPLRS